MPKVFVTVPNEGNNCTGLTAWLLHAQAHGCLIDLPRNRPLDVARNIAAQRFLKLSDATHLLTVDADVTPPPDAVPRLLAMDTDIASICTWTWNYAENCPMPNAFECAGNDYRVVRRQAGLVPCDAVGMACVLIRRDVFEQVAQPWFEWITSPDGCKLLRGEDLYFCQKVRAAGLQIVTAFDRMAGHDHNLNLKLLNDFLVTEMTGGRESA